MTDDEYLEQRARDRDRAGYYDDWYFDSFANVRRRAEYQRPALVAVLIPRQAFTAEQI